jgi:hypothetical protein
MEKDINEILAENRSVKEELEKKKRVKEVLKEG